MKIIKNKNFIITVVLSFITMIIFFPFLKGHLIADTYGIIGMGLKNYTINNSLTDGRFFMALFNFIIYKLNIPITTYVIITLFFSIIISCIDVVLLKNIILKYKKINNTKLELLLTSICYITIFNFTYIEMMYFIECIVISLSLFFYILGAYVLVEEEKNYLLKSLLCALMGITFYQGTFNFFLCLVFIFSLFKNNKNNKSIIKNILTSLFIIGIACIINLLFIKLVTFIFNTKQARLKINIQVFISLIFSKFINIYLFTCNIFPPCLFIIYLTLLFILIYLYIRKKEKKYIFLQLLLMTIYIIGCNYVNSFLTPGNIITARMNFCLGALIGTLYIFLFVKTNIFNKRNAYSMLVIFILISYIGITLGNYTLIINQSKKMNVVEKEEANQLYKIIKTYEDENNIKVTKICYVNIGDEYNENFFPKNNIYTNTTIINSTKCSWSSKDVLYYYTDLKLEYVDGDGEYKNMLVLSKDEYIFIDDTIYIKVYM